MRVSTALLAGLCLVASAAAKDDVVNLSATNFSEEVLRFPGVTMVEFFAPWCGHCRNLAPEWAKAATHLKGVVKVAAVDATVETSLASKYQVQGFPTIKVFAKDKRNPTDYQGERKAEAIVRAGMSAAQQMVKERQGGKKSSGSKSSSSSRKTKSDVVELTDDNFDAMVLQSSEPWLVEFYAPWCGHCKNLKPHWEAAATELKGDVKVGAVDATQHQMLAQRFGVRGYPTIKAFPGGTKDPSGMDYGGGRETESIVQYGMQLAEQSGGGGGLEQLTSKAIVDDKCQGKRICVVAVLPHILDSGKAGRNEFLDMVGGVAGKMRSKPFRFLWSEGGAQPAMEEAFGLSFGYPALVAFSVDKGVYSVLRGSFSAPSITSFLDGLLTGVQKSQPVGTAPAFVRVEPWDGEDALMEVDEIPLDELFEEGEL